MKHPLYLAGLFDGEGSFSIQVNVREQNGVKSAHFNPAMSMTLRYGCEVLEYYVERYGGKIYKYKDGMERWSLGKRDKLIEATQSLLPYLEIKARIAERFLEALDIFPASRKGINRYGGERAWTPEMTYKVTEIALTLNPERSRKSSKTYEYLGELRAIYGTAPIEALSSAAGDIKELSEEFLRDLDQDGNTDT